MQSGTRYSGRRTWRDSMRFRSVVWSLAVLILLAWLTALTFALWTSGSGGGEAEGSSTPTLPCGSPTGPNTGISGEQYDGSHE